MEAVLREFTLALVITDDRGFTRAWREQLPIEHIIYGEHTRFRFRKDGRKAWWEAIAEGNRSLFRCRLGPHWFVREHEVLTALEGESK